MVTVRTWMFEARSGCISFSEALPKWQADKVRGFWAKISLEHAHLTAVFAKVKEGN